jgi:hypothetical protein
VHRMVRGGSRKAVGESLCGFDSHPLRKNMGFKFFKKRKKEPENFKEILEEFKDLKLEFERISKEVEILKNENKFSVQKVGIVRYNPFKEVGGDQSFSVALLDGNDNGVVITSLYTREGNRVYGKPIKNSQSEYLLSAEEKEAIEKAKYGNKNNSKFGNSTAGSGSVGTH